MTQFDFFAILKCSENHSINQRSLGKNHKSTEKTPVGKINPVWEKKTPVWKKIPFGKKNSSFRKFLGGSETGGKNFLPFQNQKKKHCSPLFCPNKHANLVKPASAPRLRCGYSKTVTSKLKTGYFRLFRSKRRVRLDTYMYMYITCINSCSSKDQHVERVQEP